VIPRQAVCPVCARSVRVRSSGRAVIHPAKGAPYYQGRTNGDPCEGTGQIIAKDVRAPKKVIAPNRLDLIRSRSRG